MKLKRVWICILVLLVFSFQAHAQLTTIGPKIDAMTYWGTTVEQATIAWDVSAGATKYEWEAFHPETSMVILTGNTAATTITITLPKAGHFVIRLRACKPSADPAGPDVCSEWIDTLNVDYAQVDGQSKAWWIYRVLAPPGDIEFGN